MSMLTQLEQVFAEQFGDTPQWVVRAPGRVNLIGEHVDYQDGLVLPMGIDRHTMLAARTRADRRIRIWSAAFAELAELDAVKLQPVSTQTWSRYVAGVVAAFSDVPGDHVYRRNASVIPGFDAAVISDIPIGSGLSSSAALTVCIARFLDAVLETNLSPAELARRCQWAESEFGGVPCGLMDPLCIAGSTRGHCMMIDCRNAEFEHVPWIDPEVSILVADSGVPRPLAGTQYARRREEAFSAARILGLESMRAASLAQVDANTQSLGPVLARRARHAVEEIERVGQAIVALRHRNWPELGKLMSASHRSLRDLFEVSCPELDALVECACSLEGVFGSRLTGGGFGGCTISLIDSNSADRIQRELAAAYLNRTGRVLNSFPSRPSGGAEILKRGLADA